MSKLAITKTTNTDYGSRKGAKVKSIVISNEERNLS